MDEPNTPEITVQVTGLQDAPPVAEAIPEIVVIENTTTIEQTPENNTAWQGRIEQQLQENLVTHQNQTAEMLTTVQQFREILNKVLDCQIRMEAALLQLLPSPQSQTPSNPPQTEAEPVPIETPAAAEVPTELPAKDKTRRRLQRI